MPVGPAPGRRITVPSVLHPVGPLPAAVYWRRRLVVLVLALMLVGGLAWGVVALVAGRGTGSASPPAPTELPALDRVVPSVAAVRTPETPSSPSAASSAAAAPAPPPAPDAGGPCPDSALALEVRTPGQAPVGSKPTFELVVRNTAPMPCARALDKELQELVLVDAAGGRVWGSNDCFPETSDDVRVLAPGEVVVLPVVWGGLTSQPSCAGPRVPPSPGSYVVRGRLDTKASGDAPLVLS